MPPAAHQQAVAKYYPYYMGQGGPEYSVELASHGITCASIVTPKRALATDTAVGLKMHPGAVLLSWKDSMVAPIQEARLSVAVAPACRC